MKAKYTLLFTAIGTVSLLSPKLDLAMRPPGALTEAERLIEKSPGDEQAAVATEAPKSKEPDAAQGHTSATEEKPVAAASDQQTARALNAFQLAQATVS